MSDISASIVYGDFATTEVVAAILVTLTDSTGGNADMSQTLSPGQSLATFSSVPAGTWTGVYQAVGANGNIGPAFTTNSVVITATATVQIPIGGDLAVV